MNLAPGDKLSTVMLDILIILLLWIDLSKPTVISRGNSNGNGNGMVTG